MYLVIESGTFAGRSFPIKRASVIGRESQCDIVLDDTQISRQHARVKLTANGLALTDLGSRNGTYVNQERVSGTVLLSPGDRIRVGDTRMVVRVDSSARESSVALRGEALPVASNRGVVQPRVVGALVCPSCGQNDAVQKASAVVRGGVSHSEAVFRGGYGGLSGFGGGYRPAGASADGRFSGGGWNAGGMAGQISGYSVSAAASALAPPEQPQLGCLIALFNPERVRRAQAEWQRAFDKWETLYYCSRCDGAFIPGQTGLIPVERIKLVLYG